MRRRVLRHLSDDPRAVLGVGADATDADVHAAYRRLAARLHPDRPGGNAEAMAAVNAAYDQLRRNRPDRGTGPWVGPPAGASAPAAAAPVESLPFSGRLGCLLAPALVLLVVAITVAVAVALTRGGSPTDAAAPPPATSGPSGPSEGASAGAAPLAPAPWRLGRTPPARSRLAVAEWQRSAVRRSCPLLVPADAEETGRPSVLAVDGGWGVAWSRPPVAEAYGITARVPDSRRGSPPAEAMLRWNDGSTADLYRDGDRLVAELTVDGVDCRYGVFSTLGFDDLARVLGSLRFVDATE